MKYSLHLKKARTEPNRLAVTSLIIVTMALALQVQSEENLASQGVPLPALGNTVESDKLLLREIRDGQIYENPAESIGVDDLAQQKTNGGKPALSESPGSVSPADTTVWELLRQGERMHLPVSEAVERQKEQYLEEALWINKILHRSTPFMQFIVAKLQERNLPLDLALIPAIESGFQPRATSPNQAVGLWQIVPVTAKEIGIRGTPWFDPRADLIDSTRAALDYLSYLNAEFNGEWDLTLAAYNAGPGRVRSAIRRNIKRGLPTDFDSLRLPDETKAYVPKVAAMIDLVTAKPESPLDLPDIANVPSFTLVDVGQQISIDTAADIAEEKVSTISNLNAGLIRNTTPPKGPHKILLPANAVPTFRANLAKRFEERLYTVPDVHQVKKGETISSIALQYGISQREIRELNNLKGSRILIGQKLDIVRNQPVVSDNASPAEPVGRPLVHIVNPGESISTVAYKYRLSERKLRTLNNLNGNKILIGQKLAVLDNRRAAVANHQIDDTIDYVIQPGDTLSEIAVKFKVKMADILFATGVSAVDKVLIPGKRLKIRAGT